MRSPPTTPASSASRSTSSSSSRRSCRRSARQRPVQGLERGVLVRRGAGDDRDHAARRARRGDPARRAFVCSPRTCPPRRSGSPAAGVYKMERVAGIPLDTLRRHFERGLGAQAGRRGSRAHVRRADRVSPAQSARGRRSRRALRRHLLPQRHDLFRPGRAAARRLAARAAPGARRLPLHLALREPERHLARPAVGRAGRLSAERPHERLAAQLRRRRPSCRRPSRRRHAASAW